MRLVSPYIALALLFVMTPGAKDVVENAVHLVASGHTAHAIDDAEHRPEGEEHHCAGVLHSCSCHHVSAVTPDLVAVRTVAVSPDSDEVFELSSRPADGASRGIFRPPIA